MSSINIVSTIIRITDPCYDRDTGLDCIGIVGNVLPGVWNCEVFRERDNVITSIRIQHENYIVDGPGPSGYASVDSGQCGFIDESTMPETTGDYEDENSFYHKVCNSTLDEGIFIGENSFFTSTAYGDGTYRWETEMNAANEIVAITLHYIEDEEESDDEDWNEEEDWFNEEDNEN